MNYFTLNWIGRGHDTVVQPNVNEHNKMHYICDIRNYVSYVMSEKWKDVSTLELIIPYSDYYADLITVMPGKSYRYYTSHYIGDYFYQVIRVFKPDGSLASNKLYIITGVEIDDGACEIKIKCESAEKLAYRRLPIQVIDTFSPNPTAMFLTNSKALTRNEWLYALTDWYAFYKYDYSYDGWTNYKYWPESLMRKLDEINAQTGKFNGKTIFANTKTWMDMFNAICDFDPNNVIPKDPSASYRPLSDLYSMEVSYIDTPWTHIGSSSTSYLQCKILKEVERPSLILSKDNGCIKSFTYSIEVGDTPHTYSNLISLGHDSSGSYWINKETAMLTTNVAGIAKQLTPAVWEYSDLHINEGNRPYVEGYTGRRSTKEFTDWLNTARKNIYHTIDVDCNGAKGVYEPKVSYDVGDIVTLKLTDTKYVAAKCSEICTAEDGSGLNVYPIFSVMPETDYAEVVDLR